MKSTNANGLPRLPREELTKKLREGKQQMAERCLAAAKAIAEEAGVESWDYVSGLRGKVTFGRRHIWAPEPTTRNRLYVWAHECAHVALGHSKSTPVHRMEYEAERWAKEALRRHGVSVPRKMSERAKRYVAMKIERAERRGAKTIDIEALAWSKGRAKARKE